MRSLLCLTILIFGSMASAAPCGIATLTTYVTPAFSCEVGPATFNNFTFSVTNDTSDSVPLDTDDILVTPLLFANQLGLRLSGDFEALGGPNGDGPAAGLRDITYRLFFDINAPTLLFTDVSAELLDPTRFAPNDAKFGNAFVANLIDNDGASAIAGIQQGNPDSSPYNTARSFSSIDVLIALTGGASAAGTATPVGLVTADGADLLYSYQATVPEPSTVMLTLAGAALLVLRRRRR